MVKHFSESNTEGMKASCSRSPLSETQIVSSSTLVRTIKTQKIMQIA